MTCISKARPGKYPVEILLLQLTGDNHPLCQETFMDVLYNLFDKNLTCLYKYLFFSTINSNKRGQKPVKGRIDRAGYEATILMIVRSLEKPLFIETVQSTR